MTKPARTLRDIGRDNHPDDYRLTDRQREREARILRVATTILAEAGTLGVTFANLAVALRIGTATLRFHFCDLDVLLFEILYRHLRVVARALAEIPQNAPDRDAKRQAAYRALTTRSGDPTAAHLLLTRDRHLLPPQLMSSAVALPACMPLAHATG